uniref:RRM domain-containing protein n=1 Tax=Anopheles epiroticus TaxID=199890 RepID=A0A182P9J2_9DIPT
MAIKNGNQARKSLVLLAGKKSIVKMDKTQPEVDDEKELNGTELGEDGEESALEDDESKDPQDDEEMDAEDGEAVAPKDDSEEVEAEDDKLLSPEDDDSDDVDRKEMEEETPKVKSVKIEEQKDGKPASSSMDEVRKALKKKERRKKRRSARLARAVYLRKVKADCTDEEILKLFSTVGKCSILKRVRSKSFALVLLDTTEAVDKAMALNGKTLHGRTVAVERYKYNDDETVVLKKRHHEELQKSQQEAAKAKKEVVKAKKKEAKAKQLLTKYRAEATSVKLGKAKAFAKEKSVHGKQRPTNQTQKAAKPYFNGKNMAVKSKPPTAKKNLLVSGKKDVLKKKQPEPEVDDEEDLDDSELSEDEELSDLEDDESIAPEEDDSDEEEEEMEEDQPKAQPKKGSKLQQAKQKETKNGAGKQTSGAKQSPVLQAKAKKPIQDRLNRTICLKHVKPNTTDEEILEFFSSVGNCSMLKRVRGKALAMVLFDKEVQAAKAVALNGQNLKGRPVAVERIKTEDVEAAKRKKRLRAKKRRQERKQVKLGMAVPASPVVTKVAVKQGKGKQENKQQGKQRKPFSHGKNKFTKGKQYATKPSPKKSDGKPSGKPVTTSPTKKSNPSGVSASVKTAPKKNGNSAKGKRNVKPQVPKAKPV